MRRALVFGWLWLASAACGNDDTDDGRGGAGTTGVGNGSASVTASSSTIATSVVASSSASTGGACDVNTIGMIVSERDGVPDRFHVVIDRDGAPAALLFDTGSPTTFVLLGEDAPPFVADAASITLACDTITVDGRGGLADLGTEDGLPVIGILGVDYVAAGTTLVDHPAGALVRHPSGTVLAGTDAWSVLPYDDVQGLMIAPVVLDGRDQRLMVDTGAPHVLWLGEMGQPGDLEVTTTDAEGTPLTLWLGEVAIAMAGEPARTRPVLRAPSFPYFEETVAALGGNIHGLLGLSAFGARRYLIDGAAQRVLVAPR